MVVTYHSDLVGIYHNIMIKVHGYRLPASQTFLVNVYHPIKLLRLLTTTLIICSWLLATSSYLLRSTGGPMLVQPAGPQFDTPAGPVWETMRSHTCPLNRDGKRKIP